ncbi:uncharacterized protein LOC113213617 [Frankliniella occidentalis]|uniref:Uncharacterized protein LOC113213617 n=1 Tax=Frankliniella occidentalis TaxID=133901 RepID=A0A9C6X664_FRAOC|nr:uncharacterized protein LOC113213617 [Frankliniella occidentalis]
MKAAFVKSAVNAFYQSISHQGPYCGTSDGNVSHPIKLAFDKVPELKRGVAWPVVKHSCDYSAVEWLLYSGEDAHELTYGHIKNWLLVPEDFKEIMDYVVKLHNLKLVRVIANVYEGYRSTSEEESVCLKTDVSVSMVIVHPGDLLISLPNKVNLSEGKTAEKNFSTKDFVYVADKNVSPAFNVFTGTSLGHHNVYTEIPSSLNLEIATADHHLDTKIESGLHTEVDIKDEVVDAEDDCNVGHFSDGHASLCSKVQTISAAEEGTSAVARNTESTGPNSVLRRCNNRLAENNQFARLLECPQCTVTFKFGYYGRGLSLLESHINLVHRKTANMCMTVIKRKYSFCASFLGKYRSKRTVVGSTKPTPTPTKAASSHSGDSDDFNSRDNEVGSKHKDGEGSKDSDADDSQPLYTEEQNPENSPRSEDQPKRK